MSHFHKTRFYYIETKTIAADWVGNNGIVAGVVNATTGKIEGYSGFATWYSTREEAESAALLFAAKNPLYLGRLQIKQESEVGEENRRDP